MYENLAVVTVFAFLFSVIAGRLESTIISGPITFIVFGLVFGPVGLGILDVQLNQVELRVLADLTLALVLFIGAANADLAVLGAHSLIPRRLLLVGLPLSIALGTLVGVTLFPEVSVLELCILATMLVATDAALGKAVVTNQEVPSNIREGLNAESGLNDGLSVPVLLMFIALATGTGEGKAGTELALDFLLEEVGIGTAVGLVYAVIGVGVITFCARRGWINEIWQQIPVVVLALACFATAQSLGGSGYIASFVGGLLFGYFAKSSTHKLVLAAEGTGELLAMATWIVFGAAVIGQAWSNMTWQVISYAVLSLTLVRMLPVALAMRGLDQPRESKLFMGWFGPRGLASIVFAILVANEHLPSGDVLINTVVCTVTFSIIAHGLTANPLSRLFSVRMRRYDT